MKRVWMAFCFCLSVGSSVSAEDLYFTTVYSAQRAILNLPRYTHTWATFVKLSRCSPGEPFIVETFTISWLPQTLEVVPSRLRGEPGVNLSCQKTLDWCAENRMEPRQFGPFQITPELYRIEFERYLPFARGEKLYRASDILNSPGREIAVNCIYAVVAPVARPQRFRPVTLGFGYISGAYTMRRFSAYLVDDSVTHGWVNEMIGIKNVCQMRLGLFD